MVIPSIAADPLLAHLRSRLAARRGVVHATGLWGSSAPMLAALAARDTCRVYLYVTAHLEEADNARDDIELFLDEPCDLLPAWETLPGEGAASGEIEAERLALCARLAAASRSLHAVSKPWVIVAPVQALMQTLPSPVALARHTLHLTAGRAVEGDGGSGTERLVRWAIERGFTRLDLVESPGDIAVRGDLVDLFVPGESQPHRVQFLDDAVESIRRFDLSTQRSTQTVETLSIAALPATEREPAEAADVFAYLPADTLLVLDGPGDIQAMGETLEARLGHHERLVGIRDVISRADGFGQLQLWRFGPASISGEEVLDCCVTSCSRFDVDPGGAIAALAELASDHTVHVFCDTEGERQRLGEMLAEQAPATRGRVETHVGVLHAGFVWTSTRTAVVGHHEIFHRHRQRRRVRRLHTSRPLDSWTDLKPGELVVHATHGIAIYRGLQHVRKDAPLRGDSGGRQLEEFLTLEFADHAVVHVPTSQIELVEKYIGAGGRRPQLSKLGSKRWSKTKTQVAEAVAELAESLLRVQAIRAQSPGTSFPPDTTWQREFEAAFTYEETEDQLQVAAEICEDLMRPAPMDRVVCGDVGYGKTELAMRAAFKVVEYGRQVAVLVPTTVLAEQHERTFRERIAEYPFVVACLSRFRSDAEQRKIVDKLRKGQVDVVIGTHRLLSKDVTFADLGLVIIDEEQRFGVEHKEHLKALRATVDVLTLTATPIPRTLHMAMVGIRDISSLQTPPVDRRAIATQVCTFDRQQIRDAILREMNRDGQVFFVHNFVQSIAAMAETVQAIVPEARVVYGHGQMKDAELESVMRRFMDREADVLVATTIIENGIDLPSVNTIFINRAERFGLSDLHQLRGRVGRSRHRAFCYLLLSPGRPPTGDAAKRLKTIEEFSELGAGFRIAMRDLEIRGAGNLLGKEQSGHIGAVGYGMYCRLLAQAARRLRNEPDTDAATVHVDLDVAALVPAHYVSSDRARIELYRRVASCRTRKDLQALERDLLDSFGAPPEPVKRLLDLAELRILARRFGIGSISLRPPDVVFTLSDPIEAQKLFSQGSLTGKVRVPDGRTIHLRLDPRYLEPPTLLAVLRKLFLSPKTAGTPA